MREAPTIEERILEKVEYVGEAIEILSRKQSLDLQTYLDDPEEQAIVERMFQTAIEASIDIAELLIVDRGVAVPETNADRFGRLHELEVLSEKTASKMGNAASFRNVLAHNYGFDIDDRRVYGHLQSDLHWFPTFLREVRDSLDS